MIKSVILSALILTAAVRVSSAQDVSFCEGDFACLGMIKVATAQQDQKITIIILDDSNQDICTQLNDSGSPCLVKSQAAPHEIGAMVQTFMTTDLALIGQQP